MRILYITGNSNLLSSTASLNAIFGQLRPRGLEPVMVFREPGPWQQELVAQGVPCHFHPLRVPNKWCPFRSFKDVWQLVRLVQREQVELLHCNEVEHYPLARLVGRLTGLPLVATLHFIIDPSYGRWAFRAPYLPAAVQFISKAQLEYCRQAIPPELGPGRIKLLMGGLDIDDFLSRGDDGSRLRAAWGAGSETVVVGTASSIKAHKRLDDFVRLISRLRRRNLPVLGVIAGGGRFTDPTYRNKLLGIIHEEGLDGQCLMSGFLNPMAPFLKAIDLYVSTSQWETFGMSICEAMACGKPTLAYDVGGNAEAVPDPWYVTPLGDLIALEAKAVRLITQSGFRHEAGSLAARHVRENFDAPALAARQASIYEEILGKQLAGCSAELSLEPAAECHA